MFCVDTRTVLSCEFDLFCPYMMPGSVICTHSSLLWSPFSLILSIAVSLGLKSSWFSFYSLFLPFSLEVRLKNIVCAFQFTLLPLSFHFVRTILCVAQRNTGNNARVSWKGNILLLTRVCTQKRKHTVAGSTLRSSTSTSGLPAHK